MRLVGRGFSFLLVALFALGCGSSNNIRAKGRILKGGRPYMTEDGQGLRIVLQPIEVPEGQHYDAFAAEYNPDDGTFRVVGKDGAGLPPGKYRITIQLMESKEDLLKGALMGKKSPFTCEVTKRSSDLVVELDDARFDSLLSKAKQKKGRPS